MGFFSDDGSDVMDFRLTHYGVEQLRDGKLSPQYYAFFDDGVVYDGDFAGLTSEAQNDIEDRIFNYTSHVATNPRALGVDSYVGKVSSGDDSRYFLESEYDVPFGSIGEYAASSGQDDVPRWKILSVNGDFDDANIDESPLSTSQELSTMNIPQIPYEDIEYEWEPIRSSISNESEIIDNRLEHKFEDGSAIVLHDDYILLDIQELGVDFNKHNFDVTVYEVEEGSGIFGEGSKLKPLQFFKKPEFVKDGILLDESDIVEYDDSVLLEDNSLVEYYFDVLFDYDIPNDLLCGYKGSQNDNNNIYLRDDGVFAIGDGGKCSGSSAPIIENQYTVRREADLGNEC